VGGGWEVRERKMMRLKNDYSASGTRGKSEGKARKGGEVQCAASLVTGCPW
jgi:hypothetical protein